MKHTIDYYTDRGSHTFCAFIDFSKAFDRVNFLKLFHKLLDDGVAVKICSIIVILVLSSGGSCTMAKYRYLVCIIWHTEWNQAGWHIITLFVYTIH